MWARRRCSSQRVSAFVPRPNSSGREHLIRGRLRNRSSTRQRQVIAQPVGLRAANKRWRPLPGLALPVLVSADRQKVEIGWDAFVAGGGHRPRRGPHQPTPLPAGRCRVGQDAGQEPQEGGQVERVGARPLSEPGDRGHHRRSPRRRVRPLHQLAGAGRRRVGPPGGDPSTARVDSRARFWRHADIHLRTLFPYLTQRPACNKRLRKASTIRGSLSADRLRCRHRVRRRCSASTASGSGRSGRCR